MRDDKNRNKKRSGSKTRWITIFVSSDSRKCTLEQAKDKSFPTDARLVRYKIKDKHYIDVTRSAKASNIFDLYFDTYGMGAIQSIDYGFGDHIHRVSGDTSLLQTPKRKKRR